MGPKGRAPRKLSVSQHGHPICQQIPSTNNNGKKINTTKQISHRFFLQMSRLDIATVNAEQATDKAALSSYVKLKP